MKRAGAVVAALGDEPSAEKVFEAFEELDELAPDVVRQELATWLGPISDPETLDDATRRAHKMPPRPLHLAIITVTRDADLFDLGSVAEEQLRLTGKAWDGQDLAPEERLDGEIEGSFAGSLEHRVLADASDASARPLYDVVLHDGGNGIVFHAGTTRVAAMVADGVVEIRDARARAALAENLAAEPPTAAPSAPAVVSEVARTAEPEEAAPEVEEPAEVLAEAEDDASAKPKKRAAATKKPAATAKRAPSKKATAEKKSTAAKKTTATSAKRAPAKKTAAKKTTATRAAKKTAAKTVDVED